LAALFAISLRTPRLELRLPTDEELEPALPLFGVT
jgi:hypothetical protein